MSKGLFITFEGIDGCGKSTQVARAKEALKKKGLRCVVTREPGGTLIGEKIRSIILSPRLPGMSDPCETFLYLAVRAQHVHEIILPALQNGDIVLCDRFADATFAYQGAGRKIPLPLLEKMNGFAAARLQPALTFLFDITVEKSRQRLKESGKKADRLEGSGAQFYESVRQGYLRLAKQYPDRIVVLQGDRSVGELSRTVCSLIIKAIRR